MTDQDKMAALWDSRQELDALRAEAHQWRRERDEARRALHLIVSGRVDPIQVARAALDAPFHERVPGIDGATKAAP